jgi:two-component system alkaline phosphatase synthesis response regulator PhoP
VAQSVLVAEDERNIVESLSFLMNRAGLKVRVAYDGPTTLRMVENQAPDLMLLDVMMPGCDGFEVARTIRANPAWNHIRIIMLTAKGREIDRRKGIELGVDDYITKPFSTRDVMQRVKALLDSGPLR